MVAGVKTQLADTQGTRSVACGPLAFQEEGLRERFRAPLGTFYRAMEPDSST